MDEHVCNERSKIAVVIPESLPYVREGIALRQLRVADLRAFQSYRCDPIVGRYQGWTATSDEEALAFLEVMSRAPLFAADDWSQLAIADSTTDLLLGDIGLFVAHDYEHAEIGFSLAREHQGRGIATLAVRMTLELVFGSTPVPRVYARTDARNDRSIRLLERIGMRRIDSRETSYRGESYLEHRYVLNREALQSATDG